MSISQAEKDDLIARIVKAQSVGATILSNMTAAKKIAVALDVDDVEPEPEPEPDPQPEPEPDPDPVPSGAVGFQGDPSKLTQVGSQTISKAGAVVENVHVTGRLNITAANVTIRNAIIDTNDYYGIFCDSSKAQGALIEKVTVRGGSNCGILLNASEGVTIRNVDVSQGEDGMKLGGKNLTLEDFYIHNLKEGAGTHNDGIQFINVDGVKIRRGRIEGGSTSCIAMFEDQGTYRNVEIDDVEFSGGGYLLYAGGKDASGFSVTNCTFDSHGWGPVTSWPRGGIWQNNTTPNGKPVNP
jgi:hypothetical protein